VYILYMDESGVEDLGAGTSHFVLLGLTVPVEQWGGARRCAQCAQGTVPDSG
jgi:hypothetical protein